MSIRLSGVVRLAKDVRARMRAGVPEGQRGAFLDELRRCVTEIEEMCAGAGGKTDDLPAPSRRAYHELRRLAALDPDDVPLPDESSPAPEPPLRIKNVVGAMNRVLGRLATTDVGAHDTISILLENARACVEDVDEICARNGRTPSALPDKTRRAYGMLRWLTLEGNLDRYLERRDAASAAFEGALARIEPGVPAADLVRRPGAALRIRFQPGRQLYRMTGRGNDLHVHLGLGYLAAGAEELADLAEVVLRERSVPAPLLARYHDFAESEDFGALEHELRLLAGNTTYRPRGRAYDLDVLFDRLNERFFQGGLPRPHLDWFTGEGGGRFGFYVTALDLVCLETRLDDEQVPEFVAEFVLYHELLHKVHGAEHRGHRRHVHTAAFRSHERRHPRYADADLWLGRLASGKRPPG